MKHEVTHISKYKEMLNDTRVMKELTLIKDSHLQEMRELNKVLEKILTS